VPAWVGAAVGSVCLGILLSIQIWNADRFVVAQARNFYGVIRVWLIGINSEVDRAKILRVGDITHGLQFTHPQRAPWATGYHAEQSGVGLAMRFQPHANGRKIGVVGLGVGTLATYAHSGDAIRFYEINPAVKAVAEKEFTYLRDCQAPVEVVMGDARLSLEREPAQQFDLLALDAFSGDAVPVHLLTREAFETYLRHLKPEGVIAVNISNRHLNLVPVMQNLATHFHLHFASIDYWPSGELKVVYPSHWILLTHSATLLQVEDIVRATRPVSEDTPRLRLWTDDYASVFKTLK
jgi:spermidine synthase